MSRIRTVISEWDWASGAVDFGRLATLRIAVPKLIDSEPGWGRPRPNEIETFGG